MPRRARPGPGERGTTLLELVVATAIMLIATTGFVGAMRQTVNATAVGHRRTEATMLRSGLVERLSVGRRALVAGFAAAAGAWVVESCYDVEARPTATNTAFAAAFACPAGNAYTRYVSATPVLDAAGADQRVWSVGVYVERAGRGCTPATRYGTVDCVGADLFITD